MTTTITAGTKRPRALFTNLHVVLYELSDPSWRYGRPIVQMVNDWHDFPDTRQHLLSEAPARSTDMRHVLMAGAAIHALCDDAGLPVPGWITGLRANPEFMLFGMPMRTRRAATIRDARAHRTCREHGVWFEARAVRPKSEVMTSATVGMPYDKSQELVLI